MKDQRIRLAKALVKISKDVTAQDRTACMKKLKVSKVTVCTYLNGQGTNSDLALDMIELFNERIAEREKKIKALCPSN